MKRFKLYLSLLLTFLFTDMSVKGLECDDKIKVLVKVDNPFKFDGFEQFLFKSLTAYAINNYRNLGNPELDLTAEDILLDSLTRRVSFCFYVDSVENSIIQKSIESSLDRFYGGLQLNSDVLEIEGVYPILEGPFDPNFPTWLIPFIVITSLIVITALVLILLEVRSRGKTEDVEKQSLTDEVDSDDDVSETLPTREIHTQL